VAQIIFIVNGTRALPNAAKLSGKM